MANDSDFNPLLDDDASENISGETIEEEAFSLPKLEEFQLSGFGSLKDRPELPELEEEVEVIDHPEDEEIETVDNEIIGDSLEDLIHGLELDSDGYSDDDDSADTNSEGYQEAWGTDIEAELIADDEEDEDEFEGFNLDEVLGLAIDLGASDVDIIANDEVSFEIRGDMRRASEFGLLSPDVTTRLQLLIISHVLEADFVENLELDTAYVLKTGEHKGRRMRLSVGKSFGDVFLVFRVIADQIPSPEDLGVPKIVQDWCQLPNGLVLICGPTGSGKSTTFASMIRKIQLERSQKIITIEKPIEYVYGTEGKAVIVQREVGKDTRSFAGALKSAMRQHPKIIMVGEVRDQEEVDEVLRASETGHLALTTLHATSPPGAINRIMSLYEGEDRLRILSSLKDNVRGIANQTLVKTIDGESRFSLFAILPVTAEVSLLIGDGDVEGLQQYMRDNELTMEHQLTKAVKDGLCHLEDARAQAAFPDYFDQLIKLGSN